MFPTTRTRLSTAMANATLTSNSRLTNRSISFISQRQPKGGAAAGEHRLAQIEMRQARANHLAGSTFHFVSVNLWLAKELISR